MLAMGEIMKCGRSIASLFVGLAAQVLAAPAMAEPPSAWLGKSVNVGVQMDLCYSERFSCLANVFNHAVYFSREGTIFVYEDKAAGAVIKPGRSSATGTFHSEGDRIRYQTHITTGGGAFRLRNHLVRQDGTYYDYDFQVSITGGKCTLTRYKISVGELKTLKLVKNVCALRNGPPR